jgi:DNA-binding CsgD family transcriptional regulator/tetratricopeptide (TPR) repeat protein
MLRGQAGLSYRDLAQQAGYSAATLSIAASGRAVGTWAVIEAFVRACGEDPAPWREDWEQARRQVADSDHGGFVDGGEPAPTRTRGPGGEPSLMGSLPDATPLLSVSLVGRRRQVDTVQGWVVDLASGRGRAVLVEGEPGIGKSTLVRLATKEAKALGCQVFYGSCDELSQDFPLLPLLDAIDPRSPVVAEGQAKILETLRSDTAAPGNRVDLITAAVERLLVLIDQLSATAPLMLVIDDLQWADPATVTAWSRLARAVRQIPLLLVGTLRPLPRRSDLNALRRTVGPAGRLRMHSLSGQEVAEFVARAVGGQPGPRLLEQAADAGGNPLYLTELIDALVRGRELTIEDGYVEVTGGRPPGSLAAAIADRLQFLSAPVHEVLQIAALLGTAFSVSELAAVSGRTVNDLLPLLDEAIVAGVLRDDGRELAFRHPLIRAALYEGMPAAVRVAWHRDAGRALAHQGGPAERIARQLLPTLDTEGPADDWVVRWLADAAQQLVGHAPHVAIPLLRWAVAGVPAGVAPYDVLTCRLADALFRVGDMADCTQVATAALAHVTRPDLLVDLHWTLAQCRAMKGRSQESLAALESALRMPGIGPQHRARLLVLSARAHRSLGQLDLARREAEAALEEATAVDDRWSMSWALGVMTLVHGMRGAPAEALPLFDRALAITESDPALADLRLVMQINQAVALGDLDRHDDAITAAQQVRQLSDDAGNLVRLSQAQSVLGELLFDVGRWDDALAEIDIEEAGFKDPVVGCSDHGIAATIQFHRGSAGARRHLVKAEPYMERIGDQVIGPLTLAKSLAKEQAGSPAEALAVLTDGMPDTADEWEDATDLFADVVRLAITVGDREAARTIVRYAETAALHSNVPHRKAVALHCRGLLDNDAVLLLQAADHYRKANRPLPRAQALEAAGVALADSDDVAGARVHFTDAFALYTALGADWDLARTQARFRTYGIRRGPRTQHRRTHRGWDSLTPTELKVAGLVARGMSNPQIAAELFLSRRTVQTYVSHILAKLNLTSRTDIAREASVRDLTSSD